MDDTEESDWSEVRKIPSKNTKVRSEMSTPRSSFRKSLPLSPSCFIPETHSKRKPDLMQRAASMRSQWSQYYTPSREGRKFNLADHLHYYTPDFQPTRKGVRFCYNTYVPPNEKRRDRLRFAVRMSMMKGKTGFAGGN